MLCVLLRYGIKKQKDAHSFIQIIVGHLIKTIEVEHSAESLTSLSGQTGISRYAKLGD